MVGWSVGSVGLVGRSVGWSVGWSVGQSVGWSVSQLIGCLVGRWVGGSVGRLVHRLVCRSVGRLVGWLVGWLISWLVSQLVDQPPPPSRCRLASPCAAAGADAALQPSWPPPPPSWPLLPRCSWDNYFVRVFPFLASCRKFSVRVIVKILLSSLGIYKNSRYQRYLVPYKISIV